MEGAGYLRSQAELCLQMARAMSDPHAADRLRAAAARYFARALVVESQTPTAERTLPLRANEARKSVMARYFFRADFGGVSVTDDAGEEFSTLQEAELHAATVANELARNGLKSVTVSVLDEKGTSVAKAIRTWPLH